ncbi:gas vesicle protein [Streptomyces sp. NPDC026672]|uniref:gas vesicle protein GvpO n=1 Tax=unclassified Streptomyces TaxID=2593676 RepID=UPI00340A6430
MSNTSDAHDTPENDTVQHDSSRTEQKKAPGSRRRPRPMDVLKHARDQLAELTGMTAESVSSFEQDEDGWTLQIEVLEVERVPVTASLLASYEVNLDPEGELIGYRRTRRYERGRADSRGPGGR